MPLVDTVGNLQVITGLATLVLTAWTPANWTGGFTATLAQGTGCESVLIQLNQNASITAGAVTWQGTYDGINWVTIPAAQVLDPTSSTFAQIANPYTFSVSSALNKSFLILMGGYQSVRALETTPMTGAGASISPFVVQLAYSPVTYTAISNVPAVTINTGGNTIGKVDLLGNAGATLDAAIGGAASTNVLWTSDAPATALAAACSAKFINASGAAISVKASAGNLYGFAITNETAAVAYIEFFNTAGTPTLGTTAVVFALKIAASATIVMPPSTAALMNFSTGIGFAVTTTENGSTTASVTGMLFYL